MKEQGYRSIPIEPMTGVLDVRSLPELMPPGSWRFRQNFSTTEKNRLCRRTGWEKLLTKSPYNNSDLHDQLLPLQNFYADFVPPSAGADIVTDYPSMLCETPIQTRTNSREIITLLFELTTTTGARRIISGTQSRVYELNESTGNWRILGDGFGGQYLPDLSRRFKCDQVKDTLVFTNDYDKPMSYDVAAPLQGCAMRAMREISDLAVIALTKAKCVFAYKNVMFFGNVEMDGQRLQNRLIWSDYNKPKSWDPAVGTITGVIPSTLTGNVLSWSNPQGLSYVVQSRPNSTSPFVNFRVTQGDSLVVSNVSLQYRVASFVSSTIAGFQDLAYGETILAITQLGDYLVVLTDKAIWQGTPTGNNPSQGPAFSFRATYSEPKNGAQCLVYPNTLTSTGGTLFYLSRDGVYAYNFFQNEPERIEWIHLATGIIYNGIVGDAPINDQCCESHIAEYRAVEKEIWISWAAGNTCVPNRTMVINVNRDVVDTVDHGFSAFVNHRADDRPTLRDWLLNFCICTDVTLAENNIKFLKEGLPLPNNGASCTVHPTCIYTHQTIDIVPGHPEFGVMEDYNAAAPAADSLCAAFGNTTVDDLCRDCNQTQLFIGASTEDWCLKQIGTSYSREFCINPTATNTSTIYVDDVGLITYSSNIGSYRHDGYYSIMRSSPLSFGLDAVKKEINRILIGMEAALDTVPCVVQVRIGVSYGAVDPNFGYNPNPNYSQNANSGCGFLWQETLRQLLQCPNDMSPEDFVEQNLVPNEGMEWAVCREGRFLCYEIVIANLGDQNDLNSVLHPAIGGASCFSKIESWVKPCTV